jgi:hypothetical protein
MKCKWSGYFVKLEPCRQERENQDVVSSVLSRGTEDDISTSTVVPRQLSLLRFQQIPGPSRRYNVYSYQTLDPAEYPFALLIFSFSAMRIPSQHAHQVGRLIPPLFWKLSRSRTCMLTCCPEQTQLSVVFGTREFQGSRFFSLPPKSPAYNKGKPGEGNECYDCVESIDSMPYRRNKLLILTPHVNSKSDRQQHARSYPPLQISSCLD